MSAVVQGRRQCRAGEAQGGGSWNGSGSGLGRGRETEGWEGEYEMNLIELSHLLL